ncbi:MAG: fimbria major subunit [Muribaculaceae bacterium]|nr:fimbria major subunit [Muribaculaceae bacterium]
MKLRNLHHILILVSALILLPGCVNDTFPEEVEEPGFEFTPLTPVGYMPFYLNLSGGEATRAGFDYGENIESALAPGDHHFALFYTATSTNPVYIASLKYALRDSETGNNSQHLNSTVAYAELFGQDLAENETLLNSLSKCIVILNSPYSDKELWEMEKSALLNKDVNEITITGSNGLEYQTMVNSTYVDDSGVKIIEADVDPTKIVDNYITALEMAWAGKGAVVVYVERLGAKFNLEFDESKLSRVGEVDEMIFEPTVKEISVFKEYDEEKGAPAYDTSYSYRVKITGWGMNALEKATYLFKNHTKGANYFAGWNDAANFRTYWSEDPDYNAVKYPLQYRKCVDKVQYNYETLEASNENLLKNFSYDQFVEQNNFGKTLYTLENTYNYKSNELKSALGDRIDLLAGTHLIVTAELLTNINDEDPDNKTTFTNRDLYRDRTGNFYRTQKECFIAMVIEMNNTLRSQKRMKFTPYDWENLEPTGISGMLEMSTQGVNQSQAVYQLCHKGNLLDINYLNDLNLDSYIIPATVDGGDGKSILWIPDLSIQEVVDGKVTNQHIGVIEKVRKDETVGNEIHDLREEPVSENELKSFLYEWMGAIEHFTDGKMYYAVPVVHNAGSGVYGVVRNHSYSFSVEGINKVGISVDLSNQPIVPREVENNNRLDLKTELLEWHDFETSYTPGGF